MNLASRKQGITALALLAMLMAGSVVAGEKNIQPAQHSPYYQPAGPWGYGPPPGYGYGYAPWGGGPFGYFPPAYGYLPPPIHPPWGYGGPAWGYGHPGGGQVSQQPRLNAPLLNELKGKLGVRPNQEPYWNDLTKELLKLKPEENPLKSQPVLASYERLRLVLDDKQRALADGFKNSLIW